MKKPSFQNKNIFEFLYSEFKTRRKNGGIFGTFFSILQLFPFGMVNYIIKKEWNEAYKTIENSILHFYPEQNCKFKGKRPSYIALLKNYGEERIDFLFDKAHLAVTSDSIYVFPFHSAELKSKMRCYDGLDEPFRIIYNPKEKKDKYSVIKTISESVSIKTKNGITNIGFKISGIDSGRELIFDREITVANN